MHHGKSIGWGSVLLTFIFLLVAGNLVYAGLYIATFESGMEFTSSLNLLLSILPFAAVLLCFFLGLYFLYWFVDLNNLLPGFNHSPQQAMWNVLLPIVNIYGIGRAVNRVAKAIDPFSDNDHWYRLSQRLLTMLALLYASFIAVGLAILFGTTLPSTTEMVNQTMVTIFHLSAVVAGLVLLAGLLGLTLASMQITRQLIRESN